MDRPRTVSGCCPYYDHPSSRCYLTESYQDGYTRDHKCKSDSGCKTCGNYEAKMNGSNYRSK
jgi:hypothetical protein